MLLQVLDISDNCVRKEDKLEELEYLVERAVALGVQVTYWQSNREPAMLGTCLNSLECASVITANCYFC